MDQTAEQRAAQVLFNQLQQLKKLNEAADARQSAGWRTDSQGLAVPPPLGSAQHPEQARLTAATAGAGAMEEVAPNVWLPRIPPAAPVGAASGQNAPVAQQLALNGVLEADQEAKNARLAGGNGFLPLAQREAGLTAAQRPVYAMTPRAQAEGSGAQRFIPARTAADSIQGADREAAQLASELLARATAREVRPVLPGFEEMAARSGTARADLEAIAAANAQKPRMPAVLPVPLPAGAEVTGMSSVPGAMRWEQPRDPGGRPRPRQVDRTERGLPYLYPGSAGYAIAVKHGLLDDMRSLSDARQKRSANRSDLVPVSPTQAPDGFAAWAPAAAMDGPVLNPDGTRASIPGVEVEYRPAAGPAMAVNGPEALYAQAAADIARSKDDLKRVNKAQGVKLDFGDQDRFGDVESGGKRVDQSVDDPGRSRTPEGPDPYYTVDLPTVRPGGRVLQPEEKWRTITPENVVETGLGNPDATAAFLQHGKSENLISKIQDEVKTPLVSDIDLRAIRRAGGTMRALGEGEKSLGRNHVGFVTLRPSTPESPAPELPIYRLIDSETGAQVVNGGGEQGGNRMFRLGSAYNRDYEALREKLAPVLGGGTLRTPRTESSRWAAEQVSRGAMQDGELVAFNPRKGEAPRLVAGGADLAPALLALEGNADALAGSLAEGDQLRLVLRRPDGQEEVGRAIVRPVLGRTALHWELPSEPSAKASAPQLAMLSRSGELRKEAAQAMGFAREGDVLKELQGMAHVADLLAPSQFGVLERSVQGLVDRGVAPAQAVELLSASAAPGQATALLRRYQQGVIDAGQSLGGADEESVLRDIQIPGAFSGAPAAPGELRQLRVPGEARQTWAGTGSGDLILSAVNAPAQRLRVGPWLPGGTEADAQQWLINRVQQEMAAPALTAVSAPAVAGATAGGQPYPVRDADLLAEFMGGVESPDDDLNIEPEDRAMRYGGGYSIEDQAPVADPILSKYQEIARNAVARSGGNRIDGPTYDEMTQQLADRVMREAPPITGANYGLEGIGPFRDGDLYGSLLGAERVAASLANPPVEVLQRPVRVVQQRPVRFVPGPARAGRWMR